MTDLREAIARVIHESLSKQDIMAYLDGDFECGKIADAVLAILPDAEALAEALEPFVTGATHTMVFLTRREKMHPAGQDLYIEDVKRASAALANYRKGTGRAGV